MKIEDAIKSKFKSPFIKAVVNVRYTSNYMSGIQNSFMGQFDLTMPQFNILRILRGAGEMVSVNSIKERMVEKSPNTTRLLDKLIEKELISRERCEKDRRVVYVQISEKGLDLLKKIDESGEFDKLLPNHLTDEECETLSALLDKMRG
ncbi:MAG: MarR family transcriptional regulator [Bacteroidetes bacterium]|nr:MAG: MarR family transcriptional regulator [Bacteroidota bacterium]